MRPVLSTALLLAAFSLLLAGCDQLGIESVSAVAERKAADGKAVGGACRHAGRAIEDCYVLNRKSERAAVYAGWREMNEYMRENKLEAVVPVFEPDTRLAAKSTEAAEAAEPAASAAKPADKASGEKSADKRAPKGKKHDA